MKVTIDSIPPRSDARGVVFEPVDAGTLAQQKNFHTVITVPGAVRGNHFHRQGTEIIAVTGPALVRYREDGEIQEVEIPAAAVLRFIFPPGVSHAIQNTGPEPNVMVGFNTMTHDPEHPDTVEDILIEPRTL